MSFGDGRTGCKLDSATFVIAHGDFLPDTEDCQERKFPPNTLSWLPIYAACRTSPSSSSSELWRPPSIPEAIAASRMS